MNFHNTINIGIKIYNKLKLQGYKCRNFVTKNQMIDLVESTKIFNPDYYYKKYPDVLQEGFLASEHYVNDGNTEGKNPGPLFDNKYYMDYHPNLKKQLKNALLHYLKNGKTVFHSPHPLFQHETVLQYVDAKTISETTLLEHYLNNSSLWKMPTCAAIDIEDILGADLLKQLIAKGQPPLVYIIENNLYNNSNFEEVVQQKVKAYAAEENYRKIETLLTVNNQIKGHSLKKSSVFDWKPMLQDAKNRKLVFKKFEDEVIHLTPPQFVASEKAISYQEKDIEIEGPQVILYENVKYLAGTRAVIDQELNLFHEELESCLDGRYEARYQGFKNITKKNLILDYYQADQKIEKGIVISCEYDENYFHWTIECLPKILVAEEAGIPGDVPLLVIEGLHPNLMSLLHLVNKKSRPIVSVKRDHLYDFEQLYYISDCSHLLNLYQGSIKPEDLKMSSKWVTKMKDKILESFSSELTKEPFRKVYFVRRPGSIRHVTNEQAIIEKLIDKNFELVSPADLSAVAQIKLMLQSKVVIGASGAAFTNILFCRKDCKVIILNSTHANANLYGYNQVADVSKVQMKFILGPNDYELVGKYGVHDNFSIPENMIFNEIN